MKALAVFLMVQGHTVHTFLSEDFRSSDFLLYNIWNTCRGFTAPIFMFTAGIIFAFLLVKRNNLSFKDNPRVKKGLKRGLVLLLIGYVLRYPTHKIIDFSEVTRSAWITFFTVDALHLIAFGLFSIIFLYFISEKLNISRKLVFSLSSLLIFLAYPIVKSVDWISFLDLPFAAYFYSETGSLFPLFPWLGFVLAGAAVGAYLSDSIDLVDSKRFSINLSLFGVLFLFGAYILNMEIKLTSFHVNSFLEPFPTILLRLGVVILVSGIMSFFASQYTTPIFIQKVGKNSLLVYVVHLIILYGCVFFPGMYRYFSMKFDFIFTLICVIIMLFLMSGLVLFKEKKDIFRRRKVSIANL